MTDIPEFNRLEQDLFRLLIVAQTLINLRIQNLNLVILQLQTPIKGPSTDRSKEALSVLMELKPPKWCHFEGLPGQERATKQRAVINQLVDLINALKNDDYFDHLVARGDFEGVGLNAHDSSVANKIRELIVSYEAKVNIKPLLRGFVLGPERLKGHNPDE